MKVDTPFVQRDVNLISWILFNSNKFGNSLSFLPLRLLSKYDRIVIKLTNSMANGTRRFNAAFTRGLQESLSCAESQILNPVSRPCMTFLNENYFYNVRLLASRQTFKLEDHSWSALHDCLSNIFAANLHIWRPTPPSATQGMHHAVG